MSYRRSKSAALDARAYRDFVEANRPLFQASNVPSSIYETRELFDDLLMHGCLDHHPDPTRFSVSRLSVDQKEALVALMVRYLRAGFPDPGIARFPGGPSGEEIRRRVREES